MATVDVPGNDTPTVEYGCVLQVCTADDLFDLWVERAPDLAGSPDVGNAVAVYEALDVPLSDTIAVYDWTPDQYSTYWYRFRSVRSNWNDGDWTDWYAVLPGPMPIEEGTIPLSECSRLGTRWLWVEYDLLEATNQAVFSWVGSDLVTEVEIWEDTTLDGLPDTIITNGDDLARIGTYTLEGVTTGYRKQFWFFSYFADGEIVQQIVTVVRTTGGDADNYGNVILNPDFEQGAAYWLADAVGDAAIETVSPLGGAKSLKVISNATSSALVHQTTRAGDDIDGTGTYHYIPVDEEQSYRIVATGKVDAAAAPLIISARCVDVDKATPSVVDALTFTELSETRKSGYFTVPTGKAYMTVEIRMATDASAPRNGYVDDIYITPVAGILPTVSEAITYDGAGNATLTLTFTDPESRVTQVEFNTKSGTGDWSGYAVDTAPYAATVALTDKHDSHIAYKITYTAPDGSTGYIEGNVTLDVDITPEIDTPTITFDSSWNVWMSHSGDDDVQSVQYETDLTDQPTRTEVQNNGTIINARQAKTQIHTGLAEDETLYLSVLAYSETGGYAGGGNESVQIQELQITRQTGFIAPTIQSQLGYDGSGNGTITLVINDPQSRVNQVRYDTWPGGATDWTGWSIDPSAPWGPYSVALHEKHDSHIRWEVRYLDPGLGGVFIEGNATFDVDMTPELNSLDINFDDAGNATLAYHGDDDVGSIKWATSTSDFPLGSAVDSNACPTWCNDGRSHGALPLQAGTLATGETIYVSIYAFTGAAASGTKNPFLYQIKRTRISGADTILPTVSAAISGAGSNEITLTIDDPQALVTSVGFNKYERNLTTNTMEWGGWVTDSVGPPWDLTTSITRDDKHNCIIGWKVGFDYGSGTKYIENVIVYDLDQTPEIDSVSVDVDDSGDVFLSYSGDDDCVSIKYATSNSDFPTWATTTTSGTPRNFTSETNLNIGTLAEGQTLFVSIAAYPLASQGGTAGPKLGWGRVTRGTDTTTTYDTIPADVTGFSNSKFIKGVTGRVLLSWNEVTTPGVTGYEIRYGGTGWADATFEAVTQSTRYGILFGEVPSSARTYRIKAMNNLEGLESANAASTTVSFSNRPDGSAASLVSAYFRGVGGIAKWNLASTNGTIFRFHWGTTVGFTPSETNAVALIVEDNPTTNYGVGVSLAESGWTTDDGRVLYLKVGVKDGMSDELGEGWSYSNGYSVTLNPFETTWIREDVTREFIDGNYTDVNRRPTTIRTSSGDLAADDVFDKTTDTYVTIGAQGEVTYAASAPGSPTTGDLWVDTDGVPVSINRWTGSVWDKVGNLTEGALALLDQVDTGQIADKAITSVQIADNTITAGQIFANTITTNEIIGTTLSAIRANVGVLTAGLIQNSAGVNYIDLDATGNEPFIKAGSALTLEADGDATFGGTVSSAAFTATEAQFTGSVRVGADLRMHSGGLYEGGFIVDSGSHWDAGSIIAMSTGSSSPWSGVGKSAIFAHQVSVDDWSFAAWDGLAVSNGAIYNLSMPALLKVENVASLEAELAFYIGAAGARQEILRLYSDQSPYAAKTTGNHHITGNLTVDGSYPGGGATTLAALTDTLITGPSTNDVLQWNGADWVDRTLAEAGIAAAGHSHSYTEDDYVRVEKGGTLVGTRGILNFIQGSNITLTMNDDGNEIDIQIASTAGGSTTLDGLTDTLITGPSTNDVLQWNGNDWVDRNLSEAGIASSSHNHAAGDITSGTLGVNRGGTGATSYTGTRLLQYNGSVFQTVPQSVYVDATKLYVANEIWFEGATSVTKLYADATKTTIDHTGNYLDLLGGSTSTNYPRINNGTYTARIAGVNWSTAAPTTSNYAPAGTLWVRY